MPVIRKVKAKSNPDLRCLLYGLLALAVFPMYLVASNLFRVRSIIAGSILGGRDSVSKDFFLALHSGGEDGRVKLVDYVPRLRDGGDVVEEVQVPKRIPVCKNIATLGKPRSSAAWPVCNDGYAAALPVPDPAGGTAAAAAGPKCIALSISMAASPVDLSFEQDLVAHGCKVHYLNPRAVKEVAAAGGEGLEVSPGLKVHLMTLGDADYDPHVEVAGRSEDTLREEQLWRSFKLSTVLDLFGYQRVQVVKLHGHRGREWAAVDACITDGDACIGRIDQLLVHWTLENPDNSAEAPETYHMAGWTGVMQRLTAPTQAGMLQFSCAPAPGSGSVDLHIHASTWGIDTAELRSYGIAPLDGRVPREYQAAYIRRTVEGPHGVLALATAGAFETTAAYEASRHAAFEQEATVLVAARLERLQAERDAADARQQKAEGNEEEEEEEAAADKEQDKEDDDDDESQTEKADTA